MELLVFRHTWGIEESWNTVFPRIAALDYAGIEAPLLHLERYDPDGALLNAHGFRCIPMIFTEGNTVAEHVASFEQQFVGSLSYSPLLINCHSGFDGWSEDDSSRYFEAVLRIEAEHGVPVAHETHRGRIFFHPWITKRLLDRFDTLKLCCDFSHWVCVCERLIDDQLPIIRQCAQRALHVHARVGYAEGPQVPDPRAPEYEAALLAHERWWDLVWDDQAARCLPASTLTPEFGPPPYLHTMPHTNGAVADLWDICNWQAERQKTRFAVRATAST